MKSVRKQEKKGKEKTKRVWKQEKKNCLKTGENKKCLETGETDMCQLEGVWVPFGRRVGEYTFRNIYTCIGYIQPTIGGYMSFKSIYLGIWVEECMFCNILYLCWIYAANNLYLFIS